ncbi:MAG: PilZ domain-containing protein [Candidatus Omnitrophota bacterium]
MNDEQNFKERRQYKRIKKNFVLTYYDITKPDQRFSTTQLKNFSQGGVCLITDQKFPKGTILRLEIKSPFFVNITQMEGAVLESHERVKDIIYETRMQFKDLPKETEDVLLKSVEFFEKKESGYE